MIKQELDRIKERISNKDFLENKGLSNEVGIHVFCYKAEDVKLTKQQKKLQEQALEIQKYEEKIHHLADQNIQIDLDDGVKHNYELFADVLAKIK